MPHMDPSAAVRLQCQAFPEIPSWPQLPKRSVRERITFQGLSGLPNLHGRPDGALVWREPPEGWDLLTSRLRQERLDGHLDGAALTQEDAAGFFAFLDEGPRAFLPECAAVKGQCAGPVSLGLALRGTDGKPILGCASAMSALVEHLVNQALWQVRHLAVLRKPVVIFLDEPSLGGFQPQHYGLTWESVQAWYSRLLDPLQAEGVWTGFHACGKGPFHWALETSAECLHVDVTRYLDALRDDAATVSRHLRKGGWLAFGLVPTAMTGGMFPDAAALVERWMGFAHELSVRGVETRLLASRSLFSTACGLGGGSHAVAEEAARCLANFASLWRVTMNLDSSE